VKVTHDVANAQRPLHVVSHETSRFRRQRKWAALTPTLSRRERE
jgi:hypothetical protein